MIDDLMSPLEPAQGPWELGYHDGINGYQPDPWHTYGRPQRKRYFQGHIRGAISRASERSSHKHQR